VEDRLVRTRLPPCKARNQGRMKRQGKESVRLIANGYWRDVWIMRDSFNKTVFKTMRYEHDYEGRNYDRHRRDVVAAERLAGSQYVMDIYWICGEIVARLPMGFCATTKESIHTKHLFFGSSLLLARTGIAWLSRSEKAAGEASVTSKL
jgi:hypothetical protein